MVLNGLGIWGFQGDDVLKPDEYRQNVSSLLLCTLAINILSLGLPVMTLQIYDRILPNPGTGTLPVLIAGVCLAVFLEAVLRLSRAYVIGRAGASYEHHMACKAMNKLLNADFTKIGNLGVGEHLNRMGSIGKLKDFYNGHSLTVIAELIFVPIFFILIVYIARWLAVVPALILFAFIIVSTWNGYSLRNALKAREAVDDARFNFLIETLEGVHTIKAFALEKFFERRYEALEEKSTIENYMVTQKTAGTFNSGAIFSHMMVACVVTAGAWFVLNGMLTNGALIATLLLSGRMMQPIQRALALWARYQDAALARQNLETLFAIPQQKIMQRASELTSAPDGRLSIYDMEFAFPAAENPLFKDVNLQMKRGEVVLISGEHGVGKSTLLELIAGIFQPSHGEIMVDGENINTYTPEELVRHVGYIRSRPLIFRGTIRDNITSFGQISEAQAREIASLLEVDKDVAKLPGGFDTFLSGNNTDKIAPGLRQRISIVRALATKPRLILFDNADRSLDKDGYAMIYSLLARLKGKASMVLISEDYNIRGLAERTYELKNGTLEQIYSEQNQGNIRPYKELRL